MAYVPRLGHLFKMVVGIRDAQAAEGLFLEGSIEFEQGNVEEARLMFTYGTRLDPTFAGNFYNLAVVLERLHGEDRRTLEAWERYLAVAEKDPRQSAATRDKVRGHVATLKGKLNA